MLERMRVLAASMEEEVVKEEVCENDLARVLMELMQLLANEVTA